MTVTKKSQPVPPTDMITCPVQGICGVWRFERTAGLITNARSTPEHLLHFIKSGNFKLNANGRNYEVNAGAMIYYYTSEKVINHFLTDTVFYSVAFSAPELELLPPDRRVFTAPERIEALFEELHQIYGQSEDQSRNSQLYCKFLEILLHSGLLASAPGFRRNLLWQEIARSVRERQEFRPDTKTLCRKFHISQQTLIRICRQASGMPPLQYFKAIRMAEAKALLQFSGMNVSEVSASLGYPRIHEFSREFSNHFGFPPTTLLKN